MLILHKEYENLACQHIVQEKLSYEPATN